MSGRGSIGHKTFKEGETKMSTTTLPRMRDAAREISRAQPAKFGQSLRRRAVSGMNPFESDPVANDALSRLRAALRAAGYHELTQLEADLADGVVTLRGNVPTYFLKQLAQEVARTQPGVRRVINTVTVGH